MEQAMGQTSDNISPSKSTSSRNKNFFSNFDFDRLSERAADMVKENPSRMLVYGLGAGAVAGMILPIPRLLRLGLTLYPIYAAYIDISHKKFNSKTN